MSKTLIVSLIWQTVHFLKPGAIVEMPLSAIHHLLDSAADYARLHGTPAAMCAEQELHLTIASSTAGSSCYSVVT
jgi:hypothetical protein